MATPSEQRAISAAVDSAFNSILLEAFLCGLYTLLFGYALKAHLCKPNKKVYVATSSCLWVLVMLTFAFDWQTRRTAFVIDNDSRLDIANEAINGDNVISVKILDNIFSVACIWFADALLIWRCYVLWEHKRWVLLPLPFLLIAAVILGSLQNVPNFQNTGSENVIFIISFFAISITIIITGTSLIILRILLVTRSSPLTSHTTTYRQIQRVLVESGILYTITMLITGVTLGIQVTAPGRLSIPLADSEITTYTEAMLVPLAGIAPTLMTIRVSEAPLKTEFNTAPTRSRVRVLSHLIFRRTERQSSASDIEAGVSGHADYLSNPNMEQEDKAE